MGSVKAALTHFFPGISTPHHQHNHWAAERLSDALITRFMVI
jgi:hypothetical protein